MSGHPNPFDRGRAEAAEYDAWYDTPRGAAILLAEERCIGAMLKDAPRPWLDLGTGTGRFGGDLGADLGVDAAPAMAEIAMRRLPSVVLGTAEALPLRGASIGAVLSVTVFEFLGDPEAALREVARVLRAGGRAVIGFVPRAGRWAVAYAEHGQEPGSVFHSARFFSPEEVEALARAAGLAVLGAFSTLLERPDEACSGMVLPGVDPRASFIAMAFTKG